MFLNENLFEFFCFYLQKAIKKGVNDLSIPKWDFKWGKFNEAYSMSSIWEQVAMAMVGLMQMQILM